jgi:hypothetical protein
MPPHSGAVACLDRYLQTSCTPRLCLHHPDDNGTPFCGSANCAPASPDSPCDCVCGGLNHGMGEEVLKAPLPARTGLVICPGARVAARVRQRGDRPHASTRRRPKPLQPTRRTRSPTFSRMDSFGRLEDQKRRKGRLWRRRKRRSVSWRSSLIMCIGCGSGRTSPPGATDSAMGVPRVLPLRPIRHTAETLDRPARRAL